MTIDCHDDILCHIICSNFSSTIYLPVFFPARDSPWGLDDFSYKNLRGGETRFWDNGPWSSCQKNLFSTIWHLCQNFIWHIVALAVLARFRIVTHRYAASFSWKLVLCKTNNIFHRLGNCIWQKMNNIFWKYIKKKGEVTLDTFRNFAYVSSYLRLKSSAWKRDCLISPEVQRPQTWLSPF